MAKIFQLQRICEVKLRENYYVCMYWEFLKLKV